MLKDNNILFRQVDNSPLIIFRMFFGLLIFLEAWGAIATGWVYRAFIEPDYTFPFIDLQFLQPLPGYGMYFYYIIMGIAGLMVMVGLYYRLGIGMYTVMWSAVYFMQKTNYNNHYYLLMLLCMLMCLVPANAYASFDAKRKPSIRSLTCPQWCIWLFVTQITLVYIYASIAKMYPDWLEARPIAIWFAGKADYPLVGGLLQERWLQYMVAYGGIAFDLLIAPGLIWKKTRKAAFFASIFFHLFNSAIFQVGIFPYMGIAWAVFFFEPEKIRALFFKRKPKASLDTTLQTSVSWKNKLIVYGLGIYFIVQLILPIRHHFIPGNVFWTEEGHRLSWRMMLRAKYGSVFFTIKDNEKNETWRVAPSELLTAKQSRSIATRPDMCWQFVQILKEKYAKEGKTDISIYAHSSVNLNGKKRQPLYKKEVDLAQVEWHRFKHADWLTDYDDSPM
ncbi:HTTM domain-containing protein [Fulvivirga sp. RKSG066]|uniref:HTTM domain-containing protein n=1 Tax=Fulvivirga aurantia TaxID=2529383 RepID=UPI0012BBAA64|nr:HTTM domain-containing protein [Fulvivirga aurantia]MTI21487.1 HTTM domain-containing protein [Fulvivirga aurantia]